MKNKKINLNELKQIIKQIINENSNNPDIDFENFLKDCIEFEDYHNIYINNENLFETGFNVFLDEKMYEIKRVGIKKAFIDYIKGLPNWIDVPTYYYDIRKLLYAIGYDVNDMDDGEIDNFYYNKIADIFIKHADESKLKINESKQVIKENIEPELNLIGNIKKTKIKGEVPSGSEYALLNPSGKFIQKFYKFEDVKFNDGTTNHILKYYGEQGGWHPSTYNDKESRDYENLKNNKFLKII